MNEPIELQELTSGGVTSAAGFKAGGIHSGFRRDPKRFDLALIEADDVCCAAGTFTQNAFCAAPVIVSRHHLNDRGSGKVRAVVINSGIANAATGEKGLTAAQRTTSIAADIIGCTDDEVLVASTGVIGKFLPLDPFEEGLPALHSSISSSEQGGHDAAHAIMTTDTFAKEYAVSWTSHDPAYEGTTFTVGGMVKGSGMIMPNMATMIAVLTTDAPLSECAAHRALSASVAQSFNRVTVDSDTSTNDTCILLASGAAAPKASSIDVSGCAFDECMAAIKRVCIHLARCIARDGEGSTKLITVTVNGAADDVDANRAARAIANSPLVKTAVFGHDANWGRIAAALGKSGASFDQGNVSIDMMGIPVCRNGLAVAFDEDKALKQFEEPEITIDADLGAGSSSTTMWTCDLSHDYIRINGDYRS
ncbi:MAG: bifunctional glutamate N-acetyltransferase/amino-acid acetyltransferase ArgJ [Eggerthellaceae bacterium]|jgi:glutamate N-acetyltransferase/amino-acid N-acetyltransferase|nr:bifunctional glutamate N-acetyltransferase/amino-acid acetyltransferase ArgJ [Eggerthellaceae bacterium]MCH4221504.1 bifunctional glutamate N-acetyltransferase/amino-acid acetyltransferase ArgJ [Eggerthellaceae bacterium]